WPASGALAHLLDLCRLLFRQQLREAFVYFLLQLGYFRFLIVREFQGLDDCCWNYAPGLRHAEATWTAATLRWFAKLLPLLLGEDLITWRIDVLLQLFQLRLLSFGEIQHPLEESWNQLSGGGRCKAASRTT